MKKFRSIMALLLIVIMAFAPMSVSVSAASTASANKTVSITKDGYWKISIPSEGYVTLSGNITKYSASTYACGSVEVYLCTAKKEEVSQDNVFVDSFDKCSDSAKYAVSKGTYYIKVEDFDAVNGAKATFKYTFTKITQTYNYCKGKAKTIKIGSKTTIYQTSDYNFTRWYKVTLSKNQRIKVTAGGYLASYGIDIYDAKMNKIATTASGSVCSTDSTAAKGTYYILVSPSYYSYTGIGTIKVA